MHNCSQFQGAYLKQEEMLENRTSVSANLFLQIIS
jgi:hypothetical protein